MIQSDTDTLERDHHARLVAAFPDAFDQSVSEELANPKQYKPAHKILCPQSILHFGPRRFAVYVIYRKGFIAIHPDEGEHIDAQDIDEVIRRLKRIERKYLRP